MTDFTKVSGGCADQKLTDDQYKKLEDADIDNTVTKGFIRKDDKGNVSIYAPDTTDTDVAAKFTTFKDTYKSVTGKAVGEQCPAATKESSRINFEFQHGPEVGVGFTSFEIKDGLAGSNGLNLKALYHLGAGFDGRKVAGYLSLGLGLSVDLLSGKKFSSLGAAADKGEGVQPTGNSGSKDPTKSDIDEETGEVIDVALGSGDKANSGADKQIALRLEVDGGFNLTPKLSVGAGFVFERVLNSSKTMMVNPTYGRGSEAQPFSRFGPKAEIEYKVGPGKLGLNAEVLFGSVGSKDPDDGEIRLPVSSTTVRTGVTYTLQFGGTKDTAPAAPVEVTRAAVAPKCPALSAEDKAQAQTVDTWFAAMSTEDKAILMSLISVPAGTILRGDYLEIENMPGKVNSGKSVAKHLVITATLPGNQEAILLSGDDYSSMQGLDAQIASVKAAKAVDQDKIKVKELTSKFAQYATKHPENPYEIAQLATIQAGSSREDIIAAFQARDSQNRAIEVRLPNGQMSNTYLAIEDIDNYLALAKKMKEIKIAECRIEGHASKDRYKGNKKLSENRAAAVAALLRTEGILVKPENVVGYGDSKPAFDTGSRASNAMNQRVEFYPIVGGEPVMLATYLEQTTKTVSSGDQTDFEHRWFVFNQNQDGSITEHFIQSDSIKADWGNLHHTRQDIIKDKCLPEKYLSKILKPTRESYSESAVQITNLLRQIEEAAAIDLKTITKKDDPRIAEATKITTVLKRLKLDLEALKASVQLEPAATFGNAEAKTQYMNSLDLKLNKIAGFLNPESPVMKYVDGVKKRAEDLSTKTKVKVGGGKDYHREHEDAIVPRGTTAADRRIQAELRATQRRNSALERARKKEEARAARAAEQNPAPAPAAQNTGGATPP